MAFGDVVQSNSGLGTVATVAPTLGSAVTSGNLIVLQYAADDYNGTPNAGWTQSTGMEQQTFHGGYIWWFIATSNGQTIPSYTIASALRSHWTLVEYAGPFDASPYDVSNGQFQQAAANAYTTPAITPSAGVRLILAGMNFQHAASDLGTAATWLNSFTQSISVVQNGANPRLAVGQAGLVVTANGSTSYSSGATLNIAQVAQSESGLIIAFKQGSSGTNATVTAAVATATAVMLPGSPSATRSATVTAAVATATASMPAPVGTASVSATVTAAVATATAAAFAPAPSGQRNATVTAVVATASAVAEAPAVIAEVVVEGGGPATASAVMLPPTVTATRNAAVTAAVATASASMLPPAPLAGGSATVTAAVATATAAVLLPLPSATRNATVTAVVATASASMLAPVPLTTGSATVAAVAAQAYATVLPPVISAVRNASATAAAATASASVMPPYATGAGPVTPGTPRGLVGYLRDEGRYAGRLRGNQ